MSGNDTRRDFEALSPEDRLGDAPLDDSAALLTTLMRAMDTTFNPTRPKRVGIVLMMFPYGDTTGRCNYVSNGANREDMIRLLRHQADRFEEDATKGG